MGSQAALLNGLIHAFAAIRCIREDESRDFNGLVLIFFSLARARARPPAFRPRRVRGEFAATALSMPKA